MSVPVDDFQLKVDLKTIFCFFFKLIIIWIVSQTPIKYKNKKCQFRIKRKNVNQIREILYVKKIFLIF